ncbi:MAG: carboxypeptidase regulatory-like domain-containing protein [Bdellovibrionales bacterium]|nr:carboxypeptidase regulatory-like domain-containing protein [Bdellovibrionales bacterium]
MAFACLFAPCLFAGCLPLPISGKTDIIRVEGRVVDFASGLPIPNATIEVYPSCGDTAVAERPALASLSQVTDSSGNFSLETAGKNSDWFYTPLLPPFPGEGLWGSAIRVEIRRCGYRPFSHEEKQGGWQLMTRSGDFCRGSYELGVIKLERSAEDAQCKEH